ncbi:hypothetical protein WA158_003589 [Blastocystis sp. Blastoise]
MYSQYKQTSEQIMYPDTMNSSNSNSDSIPMGQIPKMNDDLHSIDQIKSEIDSNHFSAQDDVVVDSYNHPKVAIPSSIPQTIPKQQIQSQPLYNDYHGDRRNLYDMNTTNTMNNANMNMNINNSINNSSGVIPSSKRRMTTSFEDYMAAKNYPRAEEREIDNVLTRGLPNPGIGYPSHPSGYEERIMQNTLPAYTANDTRYSLYKKPSLNNTSRMNNTNINTIPSSSSTSSSSLPQTTQNLYPSRNVMNYSNIHTSIDDLSPLVRRTNLNGTQSQVVPSSAPSSSSLQNPSIPSQIPHTPLSSSLHPSMPPVPSVPSSIPPIPSTTMTPSSMSSVHSMYMSQYPSSSTTMSHSMNPSSGSLNTIPNHPPNIPITSTISTSSSIIDPLSYQSPYQDIPVNSVNTPVYQSMGYPMNPSYYSPQITTGNSIENSRYSWTNNTNNSNMSNYNNYKNKQKANRYDNLSINHIHESQSFGTLVIDKSTDKLDYVRKCLMKHFNNEVNGKHFFFLSKDGVIIKPSQEKDILAWSQTQENEWKHHTFNTVTIRHHLFIKLDNNDSNSITNNDSTPDMTSEVNTSNQESNPHGNSTSVSPVPKKSTENERSTANEQKSLDNDSSKISDDSDE